MHRSLIRTEVVLKLERKSCGCRRRYGLIRTEVVLKYRWIWRVFRWWQGLIRTEVVLKSSYTKRVYGGISFNKNRSCIEIENGFSSKMEEWV